VQAVASISDAPDRRRSGVRVAGNENRIMSDTFVVDLTRCIGIGFKISNNMSIPKAR
jgi:hypothetical protein